MIKGVAIGIVIPLQIHSGALLGGVRLQAWGVSLEARGVSNKCHNMALSEWRVGCRVDGSIHAARPVRRNTANGSGEERAAVL